MRCFWHPARRDTGRAMSKALEPSGCRMTLRLHCPARWARIVAVSKLRSHLTYANVGVTLALVLATTGFAVASIPGRAGVVSACYQRTSGSLRVIDSAKRGSVGKCRKSEKPLSWNQQGPQGLQGGRGVQGLPGVQGVQGSTGLNGGQGVKGDTGAPGPPASRIDGEVLGPVSRQVLSLAGLTLTAPCTPIPNPDTIT